MTKTSTARRQAARPEPEIVTPGPHVPSTHVKVDATADLYVNVVERDVKCAVPKDHCNCAVAQAVKRAVGREDAEAVIYPSVAYVLMPVDHHTARANRPRVTVQPGELAWHRFLVTCVLSKQILSFDETGEAAPGGYRFRAPGASQTLASKAERSEHVVRPGSRGAIKTAAPWRRDSYFRLRRTPKPKPKPRRARKAAA